MAERISSIQGISPVERVQRVSQVSPVSSGQFGALLQQELKVAEPSISFSKHAAGRIEHREIPLSQDGLERLRDGMEIARDKGLQDALILMDGSAFIVSAKNSTVITAMNSQELKNKVITNIDGTVIL